MDAFSIGKVQTSDSNTSTGARPVSCATSSRHRATMSADRSAAMNRTPSTVTACRIARVAAPSEHPRS
jgi:hypothetical protein